MDAQMRVASSAALARGWEQFGLRFVEDEHHDPDVATYGEAARQAIFSAIDRAWIATHRSFIEDRIGLDEYEVQVERLLRRRQAAGMEPS